MPCNRRSDVTPTKYLNSARLLESRIRHGDYSVGNLPTEQELADEVGVSRTTARRAMLQLVKKGLLVRSPHGKIEVSRDHVKERLRLAFLAPAYNSTIYGDWRIAVERVAASKRASVRAVDFHHWNDSVIPRTLANFDGVFLFPSSAPIPQEVVTRLSRSQNLVVLESDFSAWGIPSVQLLPAGVIEHLADHLYALGHRRIDCFNVQPHDEVIVKRMEHWELWRQIHQIEGRILDHPVNALQETVPQGYKAMRDVLRESGIKATAVICTTEGAAIGAMRALHEYGLQIGRDVSICSVDGGFMAQHDIPSRTFVEATDPTPYLSVCVDWFAKRNGVWSGPLLIQPSKVSLFLGESTTAPRSTDQTHCFQEDHKQEDRTQEDDTHEDCKQEDRAQ